ncbi:electron transfer flavoprotein subunit beta/FixA family protein [Cryobacterium levicorallinum]|uniref:Electron transfer flavoprotein subunit beta n=1 Tax=Cryobacterium levicorallinum TaxID=995038 RepID=A0A1I3E5E8_9MICO|nr:electron transfer flavoprotein subunit beta/FixA family protein [Cryobacterium levicorallinum]TFB82425.1 electron transfer flavoprotein subunit beta/FixA family protein [Cryobacterium levicorallinum]GEP28572.1 electron transfer flavoprotein subunit beta [Cryobacterium levicorallinum]SFH94176.1 electron transfer flavoprotein beta subunit [Cryobacterium levicorallinum]
MKIVVLIKHVPDTWNERTLDLNTGWIDRTGAAVIDEINERALEVALAYQDSHDAEVVVLTMGPEQAKDSLRKALAMGADSAVHVLDPLLAGADLVRTATVLAAALRQTGFGLVIAGNESTDGRGGVIASMVAELLGVSQATNLNSVVIGVDALRGERATEAGTLTVSSVLPAVISITELSATPRFATFRNIMRAKKKPVVVMTLADLAVDTAPRADAITLAAQRTPARAAGIKIVDAGDAGTELAGFLAGKRLI